MLNWFLVQPPHDCSTFQRGSPKDRMSPEPQLTGLAKTFNSVTFTGRANVAKATYASKSACRIHCPATQLYASPAVLNILTKWYVCMRLSTFIWLDICWWTMVHLWCSCISTKQVWELNIFRHNPDSGCSEGEELHQVLIVKPCFPN